MDRRVLLTEVCPNCGRYVDTLREQSGWCSECTPGVYDCARCGREFSDASQFRTYCSSCRAIIWLEQNIDAVEDYMREGYRIAEAIERVRSDNKRECLCCGRKIDKGNFCIINLECRRAYKKVQRRIKKGIPYDEALREVIE